ncbi:MAG: hypothetical protein HY675_01610 [Chloroflexi bacterium]|nr:hypothetical protein [Chloroflexota bacterium]
MQYVVKKNGTHIAHVHHFRYVHDKREGNGDVGKRSESGPVPSRRAVMARRFFDQAVVDLEAARENDGKSCWRVVPTDRSRRLGQGAGPALPHAKGVSRGNQVRVGLSGGLEAQRRVGQGKGGSARAEGHGPLAKPYVGQIM